MILLGRPVNGEKLPEENVGISSIADIGNVASKLAGQARDLGGLVGIHHSENEHEDIQAIIELKPDFLVHMCHATDEDLEKVKDAGIAIVVCPRPRKSCSLPDPITLCHPLPPPSPSPAPTPPENE